MVSDATCGSFLLGEDDFVAMVEDCRYANAEFRHADHIRLAWIYVRRYGARQAEQRIVDAIRRFATSAGHETKFHETQTRAWLRLVATAHCRRSIRSPIFRARRRGVDGPTLIYCLSPSMPRRFDLWVFQLVPQHLPLSRCTLRLPEGYLRSGVDLHDLAARLGLANPSLGEGLLGFLPLLDKLELMQIATAPAVGAGSALKDPALVSQIQAPAAPQTPPAPPSPPTP